MQIPAQSILQRTMYDPWFEHDGCGIGFVANINGRPDHDILAMALIALGNLEHRGAVADDAKTGDGAGVLTQLPRALLLRELAQRNISVAADDLALGMLFLPRDDAAAEASRRIIVASLEDHGLRVLGWREVLTDDDALGQRALADKPHIQQVMIARPENLDADAYEHTLYLARKQMEAAFCKQQLPAYIPSLSSRTVVYKGLMLGSHLADFYLDLRDPDYTTALAVYHQRYSTNTFPAWERAQPFRMLSHNGEINTLQGNINWMRAREKTLRFPSPAGKGDEPVSHIAPVLDESGSDSGMVDNALELLVMGGRDIRHAITMMAPEAWEHLPDIDPDLRAFYQYHACLMEPWDGPAALSFTDGRIVGTALDRNGLRPARYLITDDGLVVSGSEVGAIPVDERRVVQKGKLGPGQMIAVDTAVGHVYANEELKEMLATRQPYLEWVEQHLQMARSGIERDPSDSTPEIDPIELSAQQMAFGYTHEELNVILRPMLTNGQEPVGSMGDDTPAAVFTQIELGRPLFQFFKQRFAEVTNPPIDPLRETLVMSLGISLGKRLDVLEETPEHAHLVRLQSPILTDAQLARIRDNDDPLLRTTTLNALAAIGGNRPDTLEQAVDRLRLEAENAARDGATILIISDRGVDENHAPIPSLLALGAVHHHLIRTSWRSGLSLIVESGEPREVHHFACLAGYGAEAINPYLALESVYQIAVERSAHDAHRQTSTNGTGAHIDEDEDRRTATLVVEAERNFIKAVEKGILKIMSKMGISTLDSYCGAQIFEAIGLDQNLIDTCFTGTPSRVGGISYPKLAQDMQARHERAFGFELNETLDLPTPGFYKFKRGGEYHSLSPKVVQALHKAVRSPHALNDDNLTTMSPEGYALYRKYADLVHSRPPTDLRDLLKMIPVGPSIPLDEVEPIEAIVSRFSTAAMSHGSTSSESHSTLAVAMNRIGGMSNSGEGGEDAERYKDERNSKIKQVASGRFGVTAAYLASALELQIKMAQGSKPGEGGQLPGHKVNEEIASIRHTTPGVSLISPPPHHDIYSIEDLAQLIYDLKQVNDGGYVSVKLVATAGVGTIAAGVAKGYSDVILISGHSGGTGASPLSSIKNAGIPWELGLAETQQTLVLNGLRGRVRLRTDGGLRTGRDVVLAALLGADEYSFGTTALIAEGCVMARVCHSNTCPVGIATQRAELRKHFIGTPEMVMAFFRYIAQEVREVLASLGMRSLDEAVGRTDLLRQKESGVATADLIDLAPVLATGELYGTEGHEIRHNGQCNLLPPIETLNDRIVEDAREALESRGSVELNYTINNCDRSVSARLAGAIGKRYSEAGLPPGSIRINFQGYAGQSFGVFNAPGMDLFLTGDANDYVGKGMSGGMIVIKPHDYTQFVWRDNIIAGNTLLYGATGGELYAAGQVGERFAVRNSGAVAVVEGVGDHGCEYMTGGAVVVLGPTGRNFGAGMTGGVAYVLDVADKLEVYYNPQLVQLDRLNNVDAKRVRGLVERHLELTGSPYAREILADWEAYRDRFWRVLPRELAPSVAPVEDEADMPASSSQEPVAA